jgi:hypothetical protein
LIKYQEDLAKQSQIVFVHCIIVPAEGSPQQCVPSPLATNDDAVPDRTGL